MECLASLRLVDLNVDDDIIDYISLRLASLRLVNLN